MANKAQIAAASWGIKTSFHSLVALLLAGVVIGVVYLTRDAEQPPLDEDRAALLQNFAETASPMPAPPTSKKECSLFLGRWVFDNVSYPLYKEKECKYMSDQLACEKFGREDLRYQQWRWQPHGCDLPRVYEWSVVAVCGDNKGRFNATALLERLRNKRLVYVGDSLNRGQWVSMVCLVDPAIPPNLKSMSSEHNNSLLIFKASKYNATIEYYWAPLLVESNSDDPFNHRVPDRIVRVQAIEKHARHWSNADILVFDSYLWWRRSQMKVLWGSFGSRDGIYKDVMMPRAYEMALNTWSDWLEVHVNRSKTQVFFVSMSPTHERAEEWDGDVGQNCYAETEPITKEGYWGIGSDLAMMRVVKSVVDRLKARGLRVQILNITQLSEYRKEAHPSIHRRQWEPLTKEQKEKPISYADCSHWCLPGVPDVWNELLYAHIFQNRTQRLEDRVEGL